MSQKWKSTEFKGIRYREHPTRKHGIMLDKYFAIRFQKDGKRKEEGLGWGSEGWSASKAALELAKLKEAATKGEGPASLAEKRKLEVERKKKVQEEESQKKREAIIFSNFFTNTYFPKADLMPATQMLHHECFFDATAEYSRKIASSFSCFL